MKCFTILLLFVNSVIFAQTPTWSDKIAKIIYNNCTECHRTGSIGAFPLLSYSDAKANAFGIKYATSTHIMPPWKADPAFNHYKGERILTQQQIDDIAAWVDAGTPSGDLSQAPAAPVFASGIKMNAPDQSIAIPTYTVSKNTDDYRCFTINSGLTTDKFISQIEFEPANLSIVHHILLFQDNAQTCKILDNNDPLPGYASSGGGVGSNTAVLVGGWVPGGNLIDIPQGMGIRLKANCYYIIQIHYAPGSMSKKDSTRCHFKYSTITSPREVYVSPILNHINAVNGGLTNGPLIIPANTVKTFNQMYSMDNSTDYSLISVAPHQHYLGRSYKVFAITPIKDTLKMISIPSWDFHWQGAYTFQKVMKLPKLSKIYGEAVYDNTTSNLNNPSSPPKLVTLGEGTTDEMMLCYFTFAAYQTGDENIILDSTTLIRTGIFKQAKKSFASVYPNPAHEKLNFEFEKSAEARIMVLDMNGRELNYINVSGKQYRLDISGYQEGIYLIQIIQDGEQTIQRFVKY